MHDVLTEKLYNQYFDNLRKHSTLTRLFRDGEIQMPPPPVTSLMSVPITVRSSRSQAHAQTFRNHIRLQGRRTITQDARSLARFESEVQQQRE